MSFFSTAEKLEIAELPFTTSLPNPTRREALNYFRGVARHFSLDVRQYRNIESVSAAVDGFRLRLRSTAGRPSDISAGAVVVATGGFHEPNFLGIPGEELSKVSHYYSEALLEIVREWGESIESKDAYTQGHCSRVAEYACLLAQASGFPPDEMMWFRMGALLHDVGKVSVPLTILNKEGKLDEDEWSVMSRHPVYGVELLEGIEFPWDVRPMVRHHHERWDGSGYPDRLAGEASPLEARILTIADIYDALTTTRSYRRAFTHERAMEIMASEVGQSVDPGLFEIFALQVATQARAKPAEARRSVAV
jgi:putative nucleotidyltransferase with HDIG domain